MATTQLESVIATTGEAAPAPFKRLLVPLDGSGLAERALPFAQSLARTLGADLILIRAAAVPRGAADPAAAQIEVAAEAQAYLQRLADRYRTDYAVEYSVPFGEPAVEIPAVAALRGADLIAMATHGRSGVRRLVRGSLADRLVQTTRLSLLLVRQGLPLARWKHGPRRILVPLDGSELAEASLPRVAALAEAAQARLTLLQVVGPTMPELRAYEIAQMPEDDAALAERARAYLRELAVPLERRGLSVQPKVVFGTPAEQIAAAGSDHDLIAMSSHGRGGIDRFVVGSVADQVVRTADRPVLLLREER